MKLQAIRSSALVCTLAWPRMHRAIAVTVTPHLEGVRLRITWPGATALQVATLRGQIEKALARQCKTSAPTFNDVSALDPRFHQ